MARCRYRPATSRTGPGLQNYALYEIPYGICTETRSPGRHRELFGGQGGPTVLQERPQTHQTNSRVAGSDPEVLRCRYRPATSLTGPVCILRYSVRDLHRFVPKPAAQDVTRSFAEVSEAPRCRSNVSRPAKLTRSNSELPRNTLRAVAATEGGLGLRLYMLLQSVRDLHRDVRLAAARGTKMASWQSR